MLFKFTTVFGKGYGCVCFLEEKAKNGIFVMTEKEMM